MKGPSTAALQTQINAVVAQSWNEMKILEQKVSKIVQEQFNNMNNQQPITNPPSENEDDLCTKEALKDLTKSLRKEFSNGLEKSQKTMTARIDANKTAVEGLTKQLVEMMKN